MRPPQSLGPAVHAAAGPWSSSKSWHAAFNPERRHQLLDQPGDGSRDPARPASTQRPGSFATGYTVPRAHAAVDLIRDRKLHSMHHELARILPMVLQENGKSLAKSKPRNHYPGPVQHHHVSLKTQIPIAVASGPRVRSSGTFVRQEAPETLHGNSRSGLEHMAANSGR